MKIKVYKDIETVKDIRYQKAVLRKRIKHHETRIRKRFASIKENTTPGNVYNEVLSNFDMQQSLLQLIPVALKYRENIVNVYKKLPQRRLILGSLISLFAGIIAYKFYFRKKKQESEGNIENLTA